MVNTATPDWLSSVIKKAVEIRISELVEEKVKEAQEKITAQIPTIVTATAMDVFQQVDILRDQRQILIRLKKD